MPTTHSSLSGTDLHEAKRTKEPARAASTANVTIATPGASIDGVSLVAGDRVLLKNQSTASQNGLYVWASAATSLTRSTDADAAADFVHGFQVYVREGTANGATTWVYTTSTTPPVLGSTNLSFSSLTSTGGGTVTSVAMTVPPEFSVSGTPVTSSGTLALARVTQSANTVWAGPSSGSATTPAFRTIVPADIPVFGASGPGHTSGAVPDPGVSPGTGRYLREDSSWGVPPGTGSGSSSGTGGGGSGALVPIQIVGPLTATSTFLDFSSVPQNGFRNVRLRLKVRGTAAAASANVGLQVNGDTAASYSYEVLADSSAGFTRLSHQADTQSYLGLMPAASAPAGTAGLLDIAIPNYLDGLHKSFASEGGFEQSASAGDQFNQSGYGAWRNTTAINSLRILASSGSFEIGSYAALYGEMDTAGVLVTPASNLLFETTLTAVAASIDTGTLSQAYRDLRMVVEARSDTVAQFTNLTVRFNGDTGANYDLARLDSAGGAANSSNTFAQTAINGGFLSAASATAGTVGTMALTVPDYTGTAWQKELHGTGYSGGNGATANSFFNGMSGRWRNAAAITSVQFGLAAGNFVAGTVVRVYGEPVAAGGASTGTGTRLRMSGNQSTSTGTATTLNWDTEDSDADNQHFTSVANLTGTAAKVAASATLTGTGTAFLTELTRGQVISVPGTAAEKRVVIAIDSNTSLRVNLPFVNSASGQTVARVNSAIVVRTPGFYTLETNVYSAALSTGAVTLAFYLNSLTTATSGTAIGQRDPTAINASAGYDLVVQRQFQQWDFVEVVWTQNAGTVNVLADERTHFSANARPTIIVAVPHVVVKDSKAQNTAGGTFTSGADQTRDLNTLDADSAGLATVASNQVTLPAGTYRFFIRAPGYQCGAHQAFLYNVTDSTEIKRGTTETSGATSATTTASVIEGRMVLSGSRALEVRHRCTTTSTTNGFGLPANFAAEVYTVAEFWKEG